MKSRRNEVREDWLNQLKEDPILPDLPIIDPHHHLWDVGFGKYYVEDILFTLTYAFRRQSKTKMVKSKYVVFHIKRCLNNFYRRTLERYTVKHAS